MSIIRAKSSERIILARTVDSYRSKFPELGRSDLFDVFMQDLLDRVVDYRSCALKGLRLTPTADAWKNSWKEFFSIEERDWNRAWR